MARGHGILIVSMMLFAAGFPALDVIFHQMGPISAITARIILAVTFMMPIWLLLDGWTTFRHANWGRAIWVGGLGFGAGTVLLTLSQYLSDPITVGLVTASMPVSAVLLEILLDGRRLTASFTLAVLLVVTGGAVALGEDVVNGSLGLGAALGLVATVIFTWGSRETARGFSDLSMFGRATITFFGTMLFCVLTYVVAWSFDLGGTWVDALSTQTVWLLLFYAIAAMALSQVLWIIGVSKLGIGMASFHLNAVPFYIMLVLFSIYGTWEWEKLAGTAILCLGVLLAQHSDSRNSATS